MASRRLMVPGLETRFTSGMFMVLAAEEPRELCRDARRDRSGGRSRTECCDCDREEWESRFRMLSSEMPRSSRSSGIPLGDRPPDEVRPDPDFLRPGDTTTGPISSSDNETDGAETIRRILALSPRGEATTGAGGGGAGRPQHWPIAERGGL